MFDGQWWQAGKNEAHSAVHRTLEALRSYQASRVDEIIDNLKFYGWRPEHQYGFSHVISSEYPAEVFEGGKIFDAAPPLPINVIKQVVDSFVAQICRSRPRVLNVPVGAGYSIRRKAEDRNAFLDGLWYETKQRKLGRRWGIDAALCGTSFLKGYRERNKLAHRLVHLENIWFDPLEAEDGDPTSIYERRYADRFRLAALYPKQRNMIREAQGDSWDEHWPGWSQQSDQLMVSEAWHLPSGPDEDDGRHVITLKEGTLIDEPWKWDRFPFVKLSWWDQPRGYLGASLVDDLYNIQVQINDICEQISDNAANHGYARVFVPRGSLINTDSDFDDLPDTIFEYAGPQPPVVVQAQVIQPELYKYLFDLVAQAFATFGLGAGFATGQKEPGLNSAPAQRTAREIQKGRQALPSDQWDEAHLDLADLDLRLAKDLAEEDRDFSVLHVTRRYGRSSARRIKFWEVESGDEYVLRAYPTSALPETPAGKLAMVGELEDRGYLGPDEAMDLLDLPDLDRTVDQKTAGLRAVEWMLEQILDHGKAVTPEPALPLQLALRRAREAYCQALQDEVAEERIELLLTFMADVEDLLSQEAQKAVEQQAAQVAMQPQPPMLGPGDAVGAPPTMPAAPPGPPQPEVIQ